MDGYQIGVALGLAALLLVAGITPSIVALRWRKNVARAIADGVTTYMYERDAAEAMARANERERIERLKHNPWNKDGDAWNLTRQIQLMRQDFDGAVATADEAGVDVRHLRDHVGRIPEVAVVLNRDPWPESRAESTVDEPKPAKTKSKKRRERSGKRRR